jgi:hypothetical protein
MFQWWVEPNVLFICSAISSSEKCLRVSKTESYGLSRICFEMTRQATMPSSKAFVLQMNNTYVYNVRYLGSDHVVVDTKS